MPGAVLVTGASSGIGRALALAFARQGRQVLLVARREAELQRLAQQISTSGGSAQVLPADLSREEDLQRIVDHALREDLEILVNNAGFGHGGSFLQQDRDRLASMLRLNMATPALLIHHLLPHLRSRKQAAILNVGSVAGFVPVPYFCAYAASKAFLNSFTLGLAEELAGSNVHITLLAPGKTMSEFFQVAGMANSPFLQRNVMSAEDVARQTLRALQRGRRLLVPGCLNRLSLLAARFLPGALTRWTLRRLYRPR
jgi:short-subunit dehydrogenase